MEKFSLKFKQEVAEKYLEGELSLKALAKCTTFVQARHESGHTFTGSMGLKFLAVTRAAILLISNLWW